MRFAAVVLALYAPFASPQRVSVWHGVDDFHIVANSKRCGSVLPDSAKFVPIQRAPASTATAIIELRVERDASAEGAERLLGYVVVKRMASVGPPTPVELIAYSGASLLTCSHPLCTREEVVWCESTLDKIFSSYLSSSRFPRL